MRHHKVLSSFYPHAHMLHFSFAMQPLRQLMWNHKSVLSRWNALSRLSKTEPLKENYCNVGFAVVYAAAFGFVGYDVM